MVDVKSSTAKNRPLSPHLSIYRPTLTMMMSIVHRITGAALFFGTLLLVWWLSAAAAGPNAYATVQWVMETLIGRLILFGQSSGPVPPVDPQLLNSKGSLFLQRPNLAHHLLTREELVRRAGDVLGWIREGRLQIRIGGTFPLAEAAEAHRQLEARRTTGKLLLLP